MSDTLIIVLLGLGLFGLFGLPFYLRQRRIERNTTRAEAHALRYGLHEPATLHPVVSAGACVGTKNCISVCPEGDVLGFRNGQAFPVSPARCIGHGLCERACPTEAIQLVFGTEKRGVRIGQLHPPRPTIRDSLRRRRATHEIPGVLRHRDRHQVRPAVTLREP